MITLSVIWFTIALVAVLMTSNKLTRFDEKCRVKTLGFTNVQWLVLFLLFGPVGWVLLFSLLPLYLCKTLIKRAWAYLGRFSIEITKEN